MNSELFNPPEFQNKADLGQNLQPIDNGQREADVGWMLVKCVGEPEQSIPNDDIQLLGF